MADRKTETSWLLYLAVPLAWFVPGAGHVYLGRRLRGIVIFLTIAATFWTGVAIGGVMTVDPYEEQWWFIAEMSAGVHGLIGWNRSRAKHERVMQLLRRSGLLQQAERDADMRRPGERYVLQAAARHKVMADEGIALVPPAATVARAYAGVAGLLNLLCVFDVVMLAAMGKRGEQPLPKTKGDDGT